ncbi:heterokaryon incompatibility protein-domain-containing protein [Cercophora samala]|uniref:Heterokaryon incompatibility protein-domain-containing protein n=1 Tax=Cercophora samala TaxID=330535 RepID=A0AA39ZAL4_9PEZI|nr:heterokaryon incompatibility protein-domain-containing protein [Cercophora samala]
MKVSSPYTFENPHSCRHCSDLSLDLEVRRPTVRCFWCDFVGVPRAVDGDNSEYVCGECQRQVFVSGDMEQHFRVKLPYDIPGIVAAAAAAAGEGGCELYQAALRGISHDEEFLDTLIRDSGGGVGRYRVEMSGWNSKGETAGLNVRVKLVDLGTGGEEEEVVLVGGLMLDVVAFEGDGGGGYTTCRPVVREVKGGESMGFARGCLRGCLGGHRWCRTDQIIDVGLERKGEGVLPGERVPLGDIPSRVLDLGTGEGRCLKVVETGEGGGELLGGISRDGFVALSYCWGGDQKAKLLSDNLGDYKKGIDPDRLDQTLQDAIWVARELGFRYLWIDALCIIQDDLDGLGTNPDKAFEITRMASYYGRATLTILAASASAAKEGFLSLRPVPSYKTGPIALPLRCTSTGQKLGNVYLVEEHPSNPAGPSTARGWTLQESLLSRRILVFAQRQLYWSCVNSFAGAGGNVTVLTDRMIPGRTSLVEGVYPVGSLIDTSTATQWGVIVEEYTQRSLGQEGDKLWAVSALAEQMVKVGRARGERMRYVAGLLVDEEDNKSWLAQLTWRPLDPGRERPTRYRAPTWSWASVEGEVRVGRRYNEEPAVVEDWGVELAVKGAEYGALKPGAWIRLRGTVMTVDEVERYGVVVWVKSDKSHMAMLHSFEPCDGPVDYSQWSGLSDQPLWELKILEDSPEDKDTTILMLADNDARNMLLVVALEDWRSQGVAGILVERGAGDQIGLCRRRGSFFLERTAYAKGQPNVRSNFFELGQTETLKII